MRRVFYAQSSPPPPASATMDPANYPRVQTPAATMHTPTCNCSFSPNAPQVENYVPGTFLLADRAGTTMRRVEDANLAKVIEEHIMIKSIQTRSAARTEAIFDPPSLDISESEEEYGQALQAKAATKRPRASKPSAARKIILTTPRGRGDPRTSLDVDPRSARRQARAAQIQPSNIEPSTSPACMSPSKMRKACSTSTSSSLPAGGTAADEDSDSLPDLVTSSFDEDDGNMQGPKRKIRSLEPSSEEKDVEHDIGSSDSGRTCRRRRGTTSPLRDRGELPRLARPEGCYAARRSPMRGKAGEPVQASTGRIGWPD